MAKNKSAGVPPKLTEAEPDLLTHMAEGYKLETDSLGGNLVLRRLKDDEAIRPLSANRNTIKAFEERDLIRSGKGHDPRLPYIVFCAVNTNTFARGLRTSALIANAMGSRRFGMPRKSRRCLIPADGFYEWKRTGTVKQPFFFEMLTASCSHSQDCGNGEMHRGTGSGLARYLQPRQMRLHPKFTTACQ